jgi:hypothetical protein
MPINRAAAAKHPDVRYTARFKQVTADMAV